MSGVGGDILDSWAARMRSAVQKERGTKTDIAQMEARAVTYIFCHILSIVFVGMARMARSCSVGQLVLLFCGQGSQDTTFFQIANRFGVVERVPIDSPAQRDPNRYTPSRKSRVQSEDMSRGEEELRVVSFLGVEMVLATRTATTTPTTNNQQPTTNNNNNNNKKINTTTNHQPTTTTTTATTTTARPCERNPTHLCKGGRMRWRVVCHPCSCNSAMQTRRTWGRTWADFRTTTITVLGHVAGCAYHRHVSRRSESVALIPAFTPWSYSCSLRQPP